MEIWRVIYCEIDDIDDQAIGCHWSEDYDNLERMVARGVSGFGLTRGSGDPIWLRADVEDSDINHEATAESNSAHPAECEVVLLPNKEITFEVYELGSSDPDAEFTGSTGERFEPWVEEFLP